MRLGSALRHRNFRLFFAGQAISQLGDAVFFLALTWAALDLAGGAGGLGAVLGGYFAAQVALLLVGGIVVDRLPRKAVVVASDVAQGALVAALALLAFTGHLALPALIGFGVLFGAASAIAMPALSAFVPETVPREDLASATSLYQGTRMLAYVVGPAVGGLAIAAFGVEAAFAFNAFTFAASATLLALARGAPARAVAPARRSVLADVREGARYVRGQPWVWMTIAIFSVINVAEAGARAVALPVLVEDVLRGGAAGLGLVNALGAAGGLAAYVVVGSVAPRRHRGLVAYAGVVGIGAAVVAMGLAGTLWLVAAGAFARSASSSVFGLLWETSLAEQVDEGMRGRVFSLDMLGSFAFLPLAMGAAAAVTTLVGPRATLVGAGVVIVAGGALGLLLPRARRFEKVG